MCLRGLARQMLFRRSLTSGKEAGSVVSRCVASGGWSFSLGGLSGTLPELKGETEALTMWDMGGF